MIIEKEHILFFVGGAVVGAAIGYATKYFLDKRNSNKENAVYSVEEDYAKRAVRTVEVDEIQNTVYEDIKNSEEEEQRMRELEQSVCYFDQTDTSKVYDHEPEAHWAHKEEHIPQDKQEQVYNIFDVAEKEKQTFSKKDAIPPAYRGKPVNVYDIQEITKTQYDIEAQDYEKVDVIYFINEDILAWSRDLSEIDIYSSIGDDMTLKFMDNEDIEVLYCTNITMEADYQIWREDRLYGEVLEAFRAAQGVTDEETDV